MEWFVLVVMAAGAVAVGRIYVVLRNQWKQRDDDWDARAIDRLRKQGSDPFQPHEVDFFFGLPDEEACRKVRETLEADGYQVDLKPAKDSVTNPFSLHATKSIRLSAPDMKEISRRFNQLAAANGGRYDGWTAGVVTRGDSND